MKNIFLLIFFIVAVTNNLSAQNPLVKQWDKRFGGNSDDGIVCMQPTHDGGFILGGYSASIISGDKSQSNWGMTDYWIVKIDSLGIKQWDKTFGGFDNDFLTNIQLTNDGGCVIVGYSSSGIGGDKSEDTCGSNDFWLLKIDSMGNKVWDKDYGGKNDEYPYAIIQTNDGGFLIGGYSNSDSSCNKTNFTWGTWDYWIIKIDSVGNIQWDNDFGGSNADRLYSIIQTNDNCFILGGISNSIVSGNKSQSTKGTWDYWIVKVDSIGNKIWDKDFGGNKVDDLLCITKTKNEGLILGGWSNSEISGDKSDSTKGGSDYWIVETDSAGNKVWDKDFGGSSVEELYKVSPTKDGGFILSGDSYSDISGDKTENNLGIEQTWIVKIDSLLNLQWEKTIQTYGHDENGIAYQLNDYCYAVSCGVNAGIGGYKTQNNRGGYDYWIIKFCEEFIPSINLSSSDSSFCEKQCINFTDLSTNNPTSWQWFFPGADTATSTLQNPTNICYSTYGSFDVTLIACNAAGCDTLVLYNFINEFPNPTDSIYQSNDSLYSLPALTYQWYEVTGGIIPGATGQYYVPSLSQPAGYFCVVMDSIGCVATSNIIVLTAVPPLSFGEGQGVRFTPNPFESNITISFPKLNFKQATIFIRDMIGTTVFQSTTLKQQTTIDLSFLSKGIYMIEVVADDKRMVRKMVKE